MESQTSTPVEIVQELIAIHTTRKEASGKLKEKELTEDVLAKLTAASQQSDQFIAELMNELSNFGDAVQGDVDRENEYEKIWKNALRNIDATDSQGNAQTFQALEDGLKKIYNELLETKAKLPPSLQELISKQVGKL
jgi:hypothetical protein